MDFQSHGKDLGHTECVLVFKNTVSVAQALEGKMLLFKNGDRSKIVIKKKNISLLTGVNVLKNLKK